MSKFTLCAFADEADEALSGQIEAMRDNKISLLEIRGVDGVNVSKLSLPQAKQIRARLDEAGVSVWSIGSPSGKIDIADDFLPHLDGFRHMIELAHVLGASHYRLFSFYGTAGSESARDEVMTRLESFVRAAEGSGVMLCHENEKDIYGESAEGCLDIHKSLPDIRAIFDPANFVQAGVDTVKAWELLEAYVEYMHIKDAKTGGQVVPAGHGNGNIPWLLSRYTGKVLTLEPHLSVFSGLADLEHGQQSEIGEYEYPSQRAAFDAAVDALNMIMNK